MVYSYRLTLAQMGIEEQQLIIKLATEIIQNNFKHGEKIESAKSAEEQLKILLAVSVQAETYLTTDSFTNPPHHYL